MAPAQAGIDGPNVGAYLNVSNVVITSFQDIMKKIGLVLFPGFQVLDLFATTAFELANAVAERLVYDVHLVSEAGGLITSSSGVRVETERFADPAFDTVMTMGAMDVAPSTPGLLAFLNKASAASRRTASICTGAFVLAEAGLLDGRRATTHWAFARNMQQQFPKIKVQEDKIFIVDDDVWTSAGMTAGIDLCLALIEADLGVEISRAIAKKLVVYHRRTGGQSQFSALLELEPKSDRIQSALAYARENLQKDLSVEALAEVAEAQPASIQPRVPLGNGPIACESH